MLKLFKDASTAEDQEFGILAEFFCTYKCSTAVPGFLLESVRGCSPSTLQEKRPEWVRAAVHASLTVSRRQPPQVSSKRQVGEQSF
jgi:hypothetical protein